MNASPSIGQETKFFTVEVEEKICIAYVVEASNQFEAKELAEVGDGQKLSSMWIDIVEGETKVTHINGKKILEGVG